MDSVDVKALKINQSTLSSADLELCRSNGAAQIWPESPFPIDEDINDRVILYDGDVSLLRADAIVNPTNETLTQLDYVLKLAGPDLEAHIRRKVRLCSTGDVRLTPGFNSNFKFIIHAVPPKYQQKYQTAAETALFHTYFRILEVMIEKKVRSVVMPALATAKCNLPPIDNCHLQLRTIRRILEKKRYEFDRIVVHVSDDLHVYTTPFFCYFPRSGLDEQVACYELDGPLGGPNGEPVIPEREIRIKSKPALLDPNDNSIDLTSGLDLSTCVGKTQFSKMHDDLGSIASAGGSGGKSLNGGTLSNQTIAGRRTVLRGCNVL